MTEEDIISIFLIAAEVDRRLPQAGGPARLKAMNHGYIHDIVDINGWGTEKINEWRWAWLDPSKVRNSKNEIALWELSMELVKLIPDTKKRRALWAWAISETGGQPFAKWCKSVEGISRQLGTYRYRAGFECITRAFDRKPLQHNENEGEAHLPNHPEIDDKKSNIGVWRADDARPILGFDANLQDFSWAEAQNARRRERHAKKREAA